MTKESTGSKTYDAEKHDQETKKQYYHFFDDETIGKMAQYFKVEQEPEHYDALLRYLKRRRVPDTNPDHV
jgi:hypothetical protein